LAIGTGDAHQLQPGGRLTVEARGEHMHQASQTGQRYDGYVLAQLDGGIGCVRLHDHGAGTLADGGVNELARIVPAALAGEEQRTRRDPARVKGNAMQVPVAGAGQVHEAAQDGGQFRRGGSRHHGRPPRAAAWLRLISACGSSGTTLSRRMAPCAMVANTGAATWPPPYSS